MILNNDERRYQALHDLYLYSLGVEQADLWSHLSEPDEHHLPGIDKLEDAVGSIRIMSREHSLISFLVTMELEDNRYTALKVSPFPEFANPGDLIVKAWGGVFVALPENSFWLDENELNASLEVDRVDAFSLMDAQEFAESGTPLLGSSPIHTPCPPHWRDSFVKNEFGLSYELRSRGLNHQPLITIPRIFLDETPAPGATHHRLRPRSSGKDHPHPNDKVETLYSRMSLNMYDRTPLFEPLKAVVSKGGRNFELQFHSQMLGYEVLIRFKGHPVFRGPLPASIPMVLPRAMMLDQLFNLIRVELI